MVIAFLAIIVTGLAVVAPAAYLFELPRKIKMSADQYFVVQTIYLGWWTVGLLLPIAIGTNIALALEVGINTLPSWLALTAAALLVANLVIFVVWTRPVNAITKNWAVRLENWRGLRRQWEFSHAANAGVTVLAFCFAALAALYSTTRRKGAVTTRRWACPRHLRRRVPGSGYPVRERLSCNPRRSQPTDGSRRGRW